MTLLKFLSNITGTKDRLDFILYGIIGLLTGSALTQLKYCSVEDSYVFDHVVYYVSKGGLC